MKPVEGIYALILYLRKEQTLRIGRLGVFYFPVGWYVYVGSAHGGGGVQKRTDRHRKNNISKKKKWNIDFFRSKARLCEIWFSHASQVFECEWAHAFCKMQEAMIYAEKFGANDCYPYCETHFLQFETRPCTAVLRHKLAHLSKHPPIYAQFEGAFSTDPSTKALPTNSIAASYHRGRRVTECWYHAAYDGHLKLDPRAIADEEVLRLPQFKMLENEVATKFKMDSRNLRRDVRTAFAVDQLISNCGESAAEAIFSSASKLGRQSLLNLSKQTAGEQQTQIGKLVGKDIPPRI